MVYFQFNGARLAAEVACRRIRLCLHAMTVVLKEIIPDYLKILFSNLTVATEFFSRKINVGLI